MGGGEAKFTYGTWAGYWFDGEGSTGTHVLGERREEK